MFVELLAPIGSSLNRFSEGNRLLDKMEKSNELAEKKLEQSEKRLELRKRELDIIENGVRQSNLNAIQQGYQGVHLQMNPVHEPNREYIGSNPSFEQVDGRTIIGDYAY
jgi:hypothetical protein